MAGDVKLHLIPMGGGATVTMSMVDLWGALLKAPIGNIRKPDTVRTETDIGESIDMINDQLNTIINGDATLDQVDALVRNARGLLKYINYDPTLKYDTIPPMSFMMGHGGSPFAQEVTLTFHDTTIVVNHGACVKHDCFGCTLKFFNGGMVSSTVIDNCVLSNVGTGASSVELTTRKFNGVKLTGNRFELTRNERTPYIFINSTIGANLYTKIKHDTAKCIMDMCSFDDVVVKGIECAMYSCTGSVAFEGSATGESPDVVVQGDTVPSITVMGTYFASIINLTGKPIDVKLRLAKNDVRGMSIVVNGPVNLVAPRNTTESSIIKLSSGDGTHISDQFIYSENSIDDKIPNFQRGDVPRASVVTDDPHSFMYGRNRFDVNGGTLDQSIITGILRLFQSKKFARKLYPILSKLYPVYCESNGIKLNDNLSMDAFISRFEKFCELFGSSELYRAK